MNDFLHHKFPSSESFGHACSGKSFPDPAKVFPASLEQLLDRDEITAKSTGSPDGYGPQGVQKMQPAACADVALPVMSELEAEVNRRILAFRRGISGSTADQFEVRSATFAINLTRMILDSTQNPPFDNSQAQREGWVLMDVDGRYQIQKDDDSDDFKSDSNALLWVAHRVTANGSDYHRAAIELVGTLVPPAYSATPHDHVV